MPFINIIFGTSLILEIPDPMWNLLTIGVGAIAHRIGPIWQHRAVDGFQTHQLPAVRISHVAARLRPFAKVVLFLFRQRPMQTKVLRDHGAIGKALMQ